MYAIVDIAGQQLKVEENQKIFVNRLIGEEGSKIDFDKVLLVDNDGKIQVGTPTVVNMIVSATILSHMRGDTVKVFKKKRRKGYQKLNGHRQYLTQLQIESIGEGTARPRPTAKAAVKPKAGKISEAGDVAETNPAAAKPVAKASAKGKDVSKGKQAETKTGSKVAKPAAAKKEAKPKAKAAKVPAARKKPESKPAKAAAKTTKSKLKE